jgi:amidophosphoribosyltransferase
VEDVFSREELDRLGSGTMALGHTRYGASGGSEHANCQPIVVNHTKGRMAIAHNGNLVNAFELRLELEESGSIFQGSGNAEIISHVITRERMKCDSIEQAVERSMSRLKGAYSMIVMTPDKMVAVRDAFGFRPLCYGQTEDGIYIVASESCALDAVGADMIRDILPGEIVVFEQDGVRSITDHCDTKPRRFCSFELIYFARPDSVIAGCSVHEARLRAGACLALSHPVDADVVIGVPDSGLDAALGYARQSGIPYGVGFIKNRYIARTFISPGQKSRERKVRIKLNVLAKTVRGKRVVLIDDSIIRGTTSKRIVNLLRDAGATEIHFRSAAPPFLYPCYYGTDLGARESLIAYQYSAEEICKLIGADSLGYLDPADLKKLPGDSDIGSCCSACFTGEYPTERACE